LFFLYYIFWTSLRYRLCFYPISEHFSLSRPRRCTIVRFLELLKREEKSSCATVWFIGISKIERFGCGREASILCKFHSWWRNSCQTRAESQLMPLKFAFHPAFPS